jgi:hypothetical protein
MDLLLPALEEMRIERRRRNLVAGPKAIYKWELLGVQKLGMDYWIQIFPLL